LTNFVLQYLEKKAEMWLLDELATTTASAKNGAAELAAMTAAGNAVLTEQTTQDAAGIAAQKTAAAAQITTDAAVAGAGAFAATAAIPIVGPAAAPAAASAAYAGTLSFLGLAAFEAGGVVGGSSGMPVPIMAHAGERVLSASQTQIFHSLVNQGSTTKSGSPIHLNYQPQVSAYDKSGVEKMLMAHAPVIQNIIRQGVKAGSLTR
jgi:hypothetical protein